jgi:competence ComEA-like helix-hairpin-helix protein
MNRRWQNFVKDYLTFSARERNGIIIILVICSAVFALSEFLPIGKKSLQKDDFQQQLAQLKITVDTGNYAFAAADREESEADYRRPKPHLDNTLATVNLFEFDPNTLDADGWRRLGIKDKTVTTIQHFLAKGYRFRKPEDISKIYGLRAEQAGRLIPYIRIIETTRVAAPEKYKSSFTGTPSNNFTKPGSIDINTADTSLFISLPGIGGKLATRIVNFRQKLGGFSSVDQMSETYGLPDSTFQKIKARLTWSNTNLKKININTADASELKSHPYIRSNIANAIVSYRAQHGNFSSINDIRKIDIISEELFNKIAPYLSL